MITPLLPSSPQQPTLSSSIPLATTVLDGKYELVTGLEAGDAIVSANGKTALDALAAKAAGANAFVDATSYFVYGDLLGNGQFQISATGADALVYIGTNAATATGADGASLFLVDGGGTTVTTASFTA